MRLRGVALLSCLFIASCTSGPAAELRVSHAAPASIASSAAAESGLALEIDGRALDHLPPGWGSPAAARSTRITGPVNQLKGASPSTAETVLVATDRELPHAGYTPEYGSVERLPTARALVPSGCAAVLAVAPPPARPGTVAEPVVEFIIRAAGDRPELLLRSPRRLTEEEQLLENSPVPEVQTLRIGWPLEETEGEFVLAVGEGERLSRTTLWRIRVRRVADQEADAARALVGTLQVPAPRDQHAASLVQSLRGARGAADTRHALAFAAMDAGAPLTAEVAAVAEDPVIASLTDAAIKSLESAASADVGWNLDRTTLQALGKISMESAGERGLGAVLSARFGELGRDPAGLARLGAACATRADFEARLRAEHLMLLDDSSASTRVRTYDWLAANQSAPAGYDPLAPPRARRDALEKHLHALEGRP